MSSSMRHSTPESSTIPQSYALTADTVTFDIVLAHPNKPWDWYCLSINPNITFDNVLAYPEKPWDWYNLSYNPNITWEIVQANPDKPWNWDWLYSSQSK